jgi:hypothetical protein
MNPNCAGEPNTGRDRPEEYQGDMSMGVTRTRSTARTMSSEDLHRRRSACRPPSMTATEADVVLRRVSSGEPMTVAELRHAAAVLGLFVLSGRRDVLVARVRVAVRLEALGG